MKLNSKGFTLVEVLAVVIIISIVFAIMIPNVSSMISNQKENSLNEIESSIKSAARIYISDNKYELTVDNGSCPNTNPEVKQISVKELIDLGNLKSMKNGIKNPKTNQVLNNETSYVVIKYDCKKRDLIVDSVKLNWN